MAVTHPAIEKATPYALEAVHSIGLELSLHCVAGNAESSLLSLRA
jgi:hypothetical protein